MAKWIRGLTGEVFVSDSFREETLHILTDDGKPSRYAHSNSSLMYIPARFFISEDYRGIICTDSLLGGYGVRVKFNIANLKLPANAIVKSAKLCYNFQAVHPSFNQMRAQLGSKSVTKNISGTGPQVFDISFISPYRIGAYTTNLEGFLSFNGDVRVLDKYIRKGSRRVDYGNGLIINQDYWYFRAEDILPYAPVIRIDSTNGPKLDIEIATSKTDAPTSLTPNQELLNPRQELEFKWNIKERQKEFEIRWRVIGSSWTNKTVTSTQTSYKMPPGTITASSGEIEWQVRTKQDLGEWQEIANWSDWSEIATFELGAPEQPPAIIIGPDGDYIKNNEDLIFEWAFIPNTIEKQSAYELEYYIGKTKHTLRGGEERKVQVDISKANSTTGRWRVKVKNNFNQWAEWSEEGIFTIVALPNAPVIEDVTSESYPLISWRSREQGAYKLKIDNLYDDTIYDSGSILSDIDREYRVPVYLPPGRYIAKLNINNKFGLVSETTEYTFDVVEADIDKPKINLANRDYYLEIESDSADGKVLRDGKIIGELKDGRFIDATGVNNKTYNYQVMAVEGYKTKVSGSIKGAVSFKGNTIAGTKNPSDYFILRWNVSEKPKRAKSYDYESAEFKIDGKKYPVTEYGAYESEILSLVFTVKDSEIDKLTRILKQPEDLIYRDYEGFNMVGVISPIAFDPVGDTKTKQVTFSITKTSDDYD